MTHIINIFFSDNIENDRLYNVTYKLHRNACKYYRFVFVLRANTVEFRPYPRYKKGLKNGYKYRRALYRGRRRNFGANFLKIFEFFYYFTLNIISKQR